ncbi:MAG: prepilin-type N-terminal cleavage/methylation domain-containing protein [Candidatus Aminicenantes bacterium]|nr:prepilin-type N-terminal cleavage/methylation domain-containing protein [Candidatus Aminicenantes bacterium]
MNPKKRPGFSLLETTVVLSIMAVLVLIGSSFSLNNKKHQLEVAVRKIHSTLSLARFRSVQRQLPVRVSLNQKVCELAEYDNQKSVWLTRSRELLEGVEVSANNSPVFYPQGTVSGLATINIRNEKGAYQVTVAITGRIKITRLD